MAGFFLPQVLDLTNVLVLHGIRVENPPFYPMLEGLGLGNLPDLSQMAAITFCDVVVSHVPFTDGLCSMNSSTSSNTASLGFRDSRSCTSVGSCRAAATTASRLR
jgi:hypothetical protein